MSDYVVNVLAFIGCLIVLSPIAFVGWVIVSLTLCFGV
jgi:hypothetical protein